MASKYRTRYIAERSLYAFYRRHRVSYYWTMTFADHVTKKEVAEARFKPVKDLVHRRGGEILFFWEQTDAGRWHVHFVHQVYIDVNWFRPWAMQRGWGQQMRVERVQASPERFNGKTWVSDQSAVRRIVNYLVKYCTKSIIDSEGTKKKVFGGSSTAKVGTVAFAFVPWVNPLSYLYAMGADAYRILHDGNLPHWGAFWSVVSLGAAAVNWLSVDPWWLPP